MSLTDPRTKTHPPVPAPGWSEDRVRSLLEEDRSYQRITLPYGLSTRGNDRSSTFELILPDDLTGKSVLDIGCSYGYFCLEAMRRGASRALGIDVDPDSIRMAKLIAECLNSSAEFRTLDIDVEDLGEQFDYVLCLNVLHHVRNPIAVLDKLIAAVRERLILEIAAIGRHDRRKLGIWPLKGSLLKSAPALLVGRQGSASHPEQRFFMTVSAVENLLRYQRNVFAEVRTVRSDFKNRFVTIAGKRRIGHLVVVAGPTSVGKSSLIAKLKEGQLPEIARVLGLDRSVRWQEIGPRSIHTLSESVVDGYILHYDFLRPYYRSAKTHDREDAFDLLETARRVTFVTLIARPEELRRRIDANEIRPRTRFGIYRGSGRHLTIRKDYENPARIRFLYDRWLDFCRSHAERHILVSTGDQVRWYPAEDWERVAKEHGLGLAE
jgi:SAM-dependent methyltransferase